MNLDYKKIEKYFDEYNKPILKIKGQEDLHKPSLDKMIKNGWKIEFVDNVGNEDSINCDIVYMMYVLKKEAD